MLIQITYVTDDVTIFTELAIYILPIFANNFATKRDYTKRPIGLFFHALSNKTIKKFRTAYGECMAHTWNYKGNRHWN